MSCKENRKYLDAYLDGELEPGLLLEVESHLERCEGCRARAVLGRRMRAELGALGEVTAPDSLRRRIAALTDSRRRRRFWTLAAMSPVAAAAAVVLVVVTGGLDPSPEPVAAVVEDLVERHARELPLEVEDADPARTASWFQGKVDFPVRPTGLGLRQASLRGGRLSNVREHQAAQLSYRVDGHRVTMMIFPRGEGRARFTGGHRTEVGGREVILGRRNGFNVAILLDKDMAYALSSDLPTERLVQLVESL